MKDLKYVKTFEQFTFVEEELNEGLFKSESEKITEFVEANKANLPALIKKIEGVFAKQLSKQGQEPKKNAIASLDITKAVNILNDAATVLQDSKVVYPQLVLAGTELKVGGIGGGKATTGTNA
jgi:hypothetical protein